MKLSVLIPTYSYKCYTLVANLQSQLEQSGCDYEIIVAEDGSKDQVAIIHNHRIIDLPHCHHIIRRENVGRAAIRNFLASESKGDWLLYVDSDAEVINNDFICNYLSAITCEVDVIVGGLVNPSQLPSPEVTLRFAYEKAAEYQRPAEYRQQHPYERFSTFNVLVRRETILDIPFCEQCKEYGWEDFILGKEFEKAGKSILHINNPLLHVGLERNEVYLQKVEQSLHTLHALTSAMQRNVRLIQTADKVRSLHLSAVVRMAYRILRPFVRRNLLGEKPDMNLFAFYKLGYYLSL